MRILTVLVSIALIGLGVIFLIASAEGRTVPRLAIGASLVTCGGIVAVFAARPPARREGGTLEQHIDISGDVDLQQISCRQCGGALSGDSISVRAGAVFVKCPYCGAEYQIEEKPKW